MGACYRKLQDKRYYTSVCHCLHSMMSHDDTALQRLEADIFNAKELSIVLVHNLLRRQSLGGILGVDFHVVVAEVAAPRHATAGTVAYGHLNRHLRGSTTPVSQQDSPSYSSNARLSGHSRYKPGNDHCRGHYLGIATQVRRCSTASIEAVQPTRPTLREHVSSRNQARCQRLSRSCSCTGSGVRSGRNRIRPRLGIGASVRVSWWLEPHAPCRGRRWCLSNTCWRRRRRSPAAGPGP